MKVLRKAAQIELAYARMTAMLSMREALLPMRVMDGAMKPMTISGTQNMMNCPMTYCRETTTFMAPSPKNWPSAMPISSATMSRKGRLVKNFFITASKRTNQTASL